MFVGYNECVYEFLFPSQYACAQCRADQADQIRGQCEQTAPHSSTLQKLTTEIEQSWDYTGIRKIFNAPVAGERCLVVEQQTVKVDGTPIKSYSKLGETGEKIMYVDKNTYAEECNIYQDMVDNSPLVKFGSLAVAVLVALLLICGCFLCCTYFQLEQRFDELQMTVR